MAFKLLKKRIVQWPVAIQVPTDGGQTAEQVCTASFEIIEQDDYISSAERGDVALLNRVVVGFGDDIQDESGTPITCTTENKTTLFNSAPFVRVGFIKAYHDAASGGASKNSKGLPAIGQTAPKSNKTN